MTASLLRRWLNADLIVLAAVHGKHAKTVLSRPARKTVAHASRLQVAGILIPARRAA